MVLQVHFDKAPICQLAFLVACMELALAHSFILGAIRSSEDQWI